MSGMKEYNKKDYVCDIFSELISLRSKEMKYSNNSSLKWKIKSLKSTFEILKSINE